MKDNAKDICRAEPEGQKKIAEAQAKLAERDTPKNRLELAEAKAEAQFKVVKERCDDQVEDAKKACEQAVKAERDITLAQGKKQSQMQASGGAAQSTSGGAMSGSSAAGQTGSSANMLADPAGQSSVPKAY